MKNISDYLGLVNSHVTALNADNLINRYVIELEIAIYDFQGMIQSLTSGITFSHSGHLLPILMPPEALLKSLNELKNLDKFSEPTFGLTVEN